jgi:DNA-binding transcriptional ArsR family regulator
MRLWRGRLSLKTSTMVQRQQRGSASRIRRPEAIGALSAPARQEIVDTLEALGGEASVVELAQQLGRPADGLYYHLRLLCKAGLLDELAGRNQAGRGERRYRIAGRSSRGRGKAPLRLVYEPADRKNRVAVRRVVDGMLRIAGRDFAAAIANPEVVVDGARRELWAARGKGWVSAADLEEVNRLLQRLTDMLRQPRRGAGDQLVSLCFVLAPVAARPKRREPAKRRR